MSAAQNNIKKRKHSIISDYDDPAGVLAQLKKTVDVKQKARDKVNKVLANHQSSFAILKDKIANFVDNPTVEGANEFEGNTKAAERLNSYINKKKRLLLQANIRLETAQLQLNSHKEGLKLNKKYSKEYKRVKKLLDTQAASIDFKALKIAKKKKQEEEEAQEKEQKRLAKQKKRRKIVESEEEESTVDAHDETSKKEDSEEDSSDSSSDCDMSEFVGPIDETTTSGCMGLNMEGLKSSSSSRSILLQPFAEEALETILPAQDIMEKRTPTPIIDDTVPELVQQTPTSPSSALADNMQQMQIVVSGVPDVIQQIFDDSVSAGQNIEELWQETTGTSFTKHSVEEQRKLLEPFSKAAALNVAERSLYLTKVKQEKAVKPTLLPIKPEPERTLPKTTVFAYPMNSEGVILID